MPKRSPTLSSPARPSADVEYAALRGLRAVHGGRGDTAAEIAALHRAAAAPGAPADEARRLRCIAALLSMLDGTDERRGRPPSRRGNVGAGHRR